VKIPGRWVRVRRGGWGSDDSDGCNGAFWFARAGIILQVLVSDGDGWGDLPGAPWEHVSLTVWRRNGAPIERCPTWEEMAFVKGEWWGPDETVIQIHPPESEYVNQHPYCLHLWKPPYALPLPPTITVGLRQQA
jgi:hypothetical protein